MELIYCKTHNLPGYMLNLIIGLLNIIYKIKTKNWNEINKSTIYMFMIVNKSLNKNFIIQLI